MMTELTPDPGLVLVDKPKGWTSRKAGAIVSKQLGIRKIGHLGTLDPFATGLLPICVGRGTRLSHFLDQSVKGYEAELLLGAETDSADCDGTITLTSKVPSFSDEALVELARQFRGEIKQVPPAYSAIKVGGQRAYKLARRGDAVEIPERTVVVHRFEVARIADDRLRIGVECGSGTYIRSLGRDFARGLGTHGHLVRLRRTYVGDLAVEGATHPEQLAVGAVWSVATLLERLGTRLDLDKSAALHVRQGKPLEQLLAFRALNDGRYAAFSEREPIALLERSADQWRILRGLPPRVT